MPTTTFMQQANLLMDEFHPRKLSGLVLWLSEEHVREQARVLRQIREVLDERLAQIGEGG